MSCFSEVKKCPEDPIFGINAAYISDIRDEKYNLSIGNYRDLEGQPHLFSAVRKGELQLIEKGGNKDYLPISGDPQFIELVKELIFGPSGHLIYFDQVAAAQSIGGTGALWLGGAFLLRSGITDTIALSSPTWANHLSIFNSLGFNVKNYTYLDEQGELDFSALTKSLHTLAPRTAVVLHASCHNPSGKDLNYSEWEALADVFSKRDLIPFFDVAYHGFAHSLAQDSTPMRLFVKRQIPSLVAYSFSKNMGLYGERVGCLVVVALDEIEKQTIESQLKHIARATYSNPPLHGERIVVEVLKNIELKHEWEGELDQVRLRMDENRKIFSERIGNKGILQGKGMFALTGLNSKQVDLLREKYAIYLPKSGRINLAALNSKNMDSIIHAFKEVKSVER